MMRPKSRARMPSMTGRVMLKTLVQVDAEHRPTSPSHPLQHAIAGDAGVVDDDVNGADFLSMRPTPFTHWA